jgi:hypothetical protein
MPVGRYRFVMFASTAVRALLAFVLVLATRDTLAQQVALSNTRGLDFGRFVAGSGGTVVLSPAGLRSRTGGVVLLNSPSTGQAAFKVGRISRDDETRAVIITLPDNGATRLASGADSMAVGDFVNTPTALLSIPDGGTTLSVGATLTVAPNQVPGNYSGTFSLIVNYQ